MKLINPLPLNNPDNESKDSNIQRRTVWYYFLAIGLFLWLLVSLIVLLPQVRQVIINMTEQLVLHRELNNHSKWMLRLFEYAIISSCFSILLIFLLLTPLGRKLINKTEYKIENKILFNKITLKSILSSDYLTM